MPPQPSNIPADVVECIVEFLPSRKDVYHCTLVSRLFHDVSIPLLYETLDIRVPAVRRDGDHVRVLDPFDTIARKVFYAPYVRNVLQCARQTSTERLGTLQLCRNLRSFSWTDSCSLGDTDIVFCAYLDAVQDIGIDELHVKVSSGISDCMWTRLMRFNGLSSFGVTSSHMPRSDLDAWAARVGPRLTKLDFSVSSEAVRHPQFIHHMVHLRSLRLDAPTNSISEVLSLLPHLTSLDVRYRTSAAAHTFLAPPAARLRTLTVHVIQEGGASGLWEWILGLAPHWNTLDNLTIHNRAPQGDATVPLQFVHRLAQLHGATIRQIFLYNVVAGSDAEHMLFTSFAKLEALSFIQQVHSLRTITNIVHSAKHLKTLMLQYTRRTPLDDPQHLMNIALQWMDRTNRRATLTCISLGPQIYKGTWTYSERRRQPIFEVYRDIDARSRWM